MVTSPSFHDIHGEIPEIQRISQGLLTSAPSQHLDSTNDLRRLHVDHLGAETAARTSSALLRNLGDENDPAVGKR